MRKAYIYINYHNTVVLTVYLDVIKAALTRLGYECTYVKDLHGVGKRDLIVFPTGLDAFKYYHRGYRNIIFWQQGAAGAESYMRNSSKIRRLILNYMDCFVMRKAKMIFYVSHYMREYYEKMAHRSFGSKAYVMPCFNESLEEGAIAAKDYSRNVFTYVGSLALWQCFAETADIYAEIEKRVPNAFFKVLTFNTEDAERIIREKGIRHYSVACVPKEQVRKELEDATYGFIIRRDVDVNRVATPTKISSYLSVGVLPIYSTCLRDFHAQAEGKSFACAMNPEDNIDGLLSYINTVREKTVIEREVKELFDTYYSAEKHISNIAELAKVCLE